ncbi:MAG: amidohydrolase [Ferruginibacter sp.]
MSDLTITIIQTKLLWENKEANLLVLEQKIESIPERTEIVLLPEMFSTGFSMKSEILAETMEGKTVFWMKEQASKNGVAITGSIIINEGDKFFNRLICMLPNGEYGYYDKRHLFAYANEDEHYSAGNKRLIASVKGWKINLQVCYDLRFPVWARHSISQEKNEPEFDVLVYVANWPEARSHAWKTLLCARAIENQCYVIGVNRVGRDGNEIYYSGNSMVIDPLGEVLYHMADDEDIFTISLQKEHLAQVRSKYPFWKDADNFNIINNKD